MDRKKALPSIKPYEIQLDRAIRWKIKIEKILDDYRTGTYSENAIILLDMMYVFFIFCYHVSDYIKNDDEISIDKNSIYDYIRENECLKICADLCHGIKHLYLSNPKMGREDFKVNLKIDHHLETTKITTVSLRIVSQTIDVEFSELAEDCIKKWNEFIKKKIQ